MSVILHSLDKTYISLLLCWLERGNILFFLLIFFFCFSSKFAHLYCFHRLQFLTQINARFQVCTSHKGTGVLVLWGEYRYYGCPIAMNRLGYFFIGKRSGSFYFQSLVYVDHILYTDIQLDHHWSKRGI